MANTCTQYNNREGLTEKRQPGRRILFRFSTDKEEQKRPHQIYQNNNLFQEKMSLTTNYHIYKRQFSMAHVQKERKWTAVIKNLLIKAMRSFVFFEH
jgi:hypothetical protein